ncbi:MAG: PTS sugar transporter subunit IIA [Maricaulis sp.]|uniref:PTS sugar transporter subunit IIA n=1 Tax=Maricaulis sp. TaxID=1486257 RepID=UPI001AFD3978|nr:PTS sugar transporter subunit IIA [Maricaulis sp.]MBO6728807.1 PTS sugar transporter subunit IIA [Maricaulis sp.]MBO6847625.1 PTS sugar transporter subunit IIA [Maricaulis sp.]MBO6876948.1 PTS sugar transporter subunit IIA [Maricaulis sp.]MEC9250499.1 PTS sugar transporter subunit IIA [Pseudomonadota bacterium]
MIGLVIVSHGRLADELVAATEHVVGPMDALLAVCIGPDDDMERRRGDIRDSIADADRGEGVLVLTDMFGGTPSNLAISLLDPGKVEVIAGVNLPMLIKLAEARSRTDLDSLARMGVDAGKRYIAIASSVLEGAGK